MSPRVLLRPALVALVSCLAVPLASAANDFVVKVEVGETVKRKVLPTPGCLAHFTVTGGDPAVAEVKYNQKKMYRKKLKLKIKGVAVGTTSITVNYTEMEPCNGSGSVRLQIQVVPSKKQLIEAVLKAFKKERNQADNEMENAYTGVKSGLKSIGSGLGNSPDVMADIAEAFDIVNCGVFDIYHAGRMALVDARDFANTQLMGLGVDETDLPSDLVAGTCDGWDKLRMNVWYDGHEYTQMTLKLQKKFYDDVEKHTDWRITGAYVTGTAFDMPGPYGAGATPHADPKHRLRIFESWALSMNTTQSNFDTWVLVGGQADPTLGGVKVTATTTLGDSVQTTVTPDAQGKWSASFPPSDMLQAGSTVSLHAEYTAPGAGDEDHDDMWVYIPLQFKF